MKAAQFLFGLCALVQCSVSVSAFFVPEHVSKMVASTSNPFGPVCPVYPKPAKIGCGIKKEPIKKNHLITHGHAPNVTTCAERCLLDSTCQSFTYTDVCERCKLYSKTAKKMAVRYSDDDTLFYNRDCFSQFSPAFFLLAVTAPQNSPFYGQFVYADINSTVDPGLNPARFVNLTEYNSTDPAPVFAILCDNSIANVAVAIEDQSIGAFTTYEGVVDPLVPGNVFFPSDNGTTSFPTPGDELFCSVGSRKNVNGTLLCDFGGGNTFYGCTGTLPNNSLAIGTSGTAPPGNCTKVKLTALFADEIGPT